MTDDARRKEKDSVTIGQIRGRYLKNLDRQIDELANLIRKGYHQKGAAENFLRNDIGSTLTTLDNLDSFASAVVLFPDSTTARD